MVFHGSDKKRHSLKRLGAPSIFGVKWKTQKMAASSSEIISEWIRSLMNYFRLNDSQPICSALIICDISDIYFLLFFFFLCVNKWRIRSKKEIEKKEEEREPLCDEVKLAFSRNRNNICLARPGHCLSRTSLSFPAKHPHWCTSDHSVDTLRNQQESERMRGC